MKDAPEVQALLSIGSLQELGVDQTNTSGRNRLYSAWNRIYDNHIGLFLDTENDSWVREIDMLVKLGIGHQTVVDENTGNTVLHTAITYKGGEVGLVELLVEAGADLDAQNYDGDTPCHLASSELLEVLLKAGANTDIQNEKGNTPLHEASRSGKKECVKD